MFLVAWNMSDGTVNIHRKNCPHRKPSRNPGRSGHWAQDQVEFGETDWSSQEAFAHDYWYNGIAEEWNAENPGKKFDVFQEMDFNSCVTDTLPLEAEPEVEPDPAPGPDLYLWIISHPVHGQSIRTTPCYGGNPARVAQAIKDGVEPPGWSETRIKIHPKTVASLRKMLA